MLRSIYTLGVLALDVLGVAAGGNSASAHDLAVGVLAPRASSHRKPRVEDARFLPPLGGRPKETNDVKLLDIVLVATVDGKFHALNRTSGESLWSMSGTTNHGAGASTGLPAMAPLVRTNHIPDDHDDDGTPHQEQYIIEPQSGAIYVLTDPSAPLQQFPVTMSQLVDYSPFEIPGEEDGRVFVGKKETSLLVIELETGRVLRTVSSECPWEHEDEVVKSSLTEVDLDDLEDFTERQESTSTEVYIGRTDYHVSIHTRWLDRSQPRPPVQNLSFSVYGPNNQDAAFQSTYHRSADDTYLQSLPNGQLVSVKARTQGSGDEPLRWDRTFRDPVVAVFDLVKNSQRQHPFALLQPRPRLQDFFPHINLAAAKKANQLPNYGSAFVGLVGDSLFAMSPERFPLVVFDISGIAPLRATIDGPSGKDWDKDERLEVITERRKLAQLCRGGASMDPRCLTGVRQLGASSQSRLSRLIDASDEPPLESESKGGHIPEDVIANTTPSADALVMSVGATAQSELLPLSDAPLLSSPALASVLSLIFAIFAFLPAPALASILSLIFAMVAFILLRHSRFPARTTIHEKTSTEADISVPVGAGATNGDVELPLTPTTAVSVAFEEPTPANGSLPLDPAEQDQELREGDDSDKENGDVGATPGKRRPVRRKRGKKKRTGGANGSAGAEDGEAAERGDGDADAGEVEAATLLVIPPTPIVAPAQSLVVSDEILGFGSHGTMVFRGSLQGRAVAVKRLLQDFVTLASREVGILQESDDHPNVIRYYYQEAHANFLYIALELCPASLADVVERPDQFRELAVSFDPKRALRQITSGLRHLHALKIVHRDIKPQNILVSAAKKGAGYRMLISDFGLCKKLEFDQTSFLPTMGGVMGAGTVGWRAPEILRGEVNLDETLTDDHSQSSRGSVATVSGGSNGPIRPTRLTKAVDIFALGCLFYYTLTNGGHPFGDRYEREANIIKDIKSLDGLERFGEEGAEAVGLITAMLSPEAPRRPDTTTCLVHPFFWDPGRRLTFLQDASDRFEIMCRDPRDVLLIELENGAFGVVGNDWHARLDRVFLENLGKFRKYDGRSVQDLMRALRNKKHHYQDLPDNVKRHVGAMPEGFLAYFTRRFPRLFLHVYGVVEASMLRHESMFRSYFELTE